MDGTVRFSRHAVERYIERLRPGLTVTAALRELDRLAGEGALAADPPVWTGPHAERRDGYLVLGDVCLPLLATPAGWLAVTTIARGELPAGLRAHRNRLAAARRARRRKLRRKPRRDGRPARRLEPFDATAEAA